MFNFKKSSLIAALVCLSATSAFANDVCGQITDTIHLPAYSFRLTAEDGTALAQMPATAEVDLSRGVWDGDHWGSNPDNIQIAVTYDASSGIYQTAATDVKIPSHWSGLDPSCSEKIQSFKVLFNNPPKDTTIGFDITRENQSFEYDFPQTGSAYSLPDASVVHTIIVQALTEVIGVFDDPTHFVDASGKTLVVSWEGQPSNDGVIAQASVGLTPAEIALIDGSVAQKTTVLIYGEPSAEGTFYILNVASK